MKNFKLGLLALAALTLSAGAQAHEFERLRHERGRHWSQACQLSAAPRRVVYEAPRPVVYVPVQRVQPQRVVLQPGLQIRLAFGL